jgi:hypothetical protein
MESNYLIKNPSHAMIVEAIKTLPGEPESINLELFADGIQFPKFPQNEEMVKEYIETCKYQGIIPFSKKEIAYDFHCEERIPKNDTAAKEFFGKGRTQKIELRIANGFENNNIQRFNEIVLPSLLKNNYKVSYGEIIISGHKTGSHESEGYEPDLALRINYGREKGLGLLLDDSHKQANEEKLTYQTWFDNLKEKYKVSD